MNLLRISSIIALLATVGSSSNAQSITASLGWTNFVEGVSPVENAFVLSGAPSGTFSVSFYIDKYSGLPLQIDNKGSDGWSKIFDMGNVQPGAKLNVVCLNLLGDTLASVTPQPITMIPRPEWLRTSTLSNVRVVGRRVEFDAHYPIAGLLNSRVPDSVVGLKNRPFLVSNAAANLAISYDLDSRTSTVANPYIDLVINVFNQKVAQRKFPVPITGIQLDQDFNLRYEAADSLQVPLFRLDIPTIYIPIAGFADLEFDAGVSLWASLKGRVLVGNDGPLWGFVRNSDTVSGISAKVYGSGYVRAGIRVLYGALSVRGTLSIDGVLGGGFDYVSVPSVETNSYFGGAFSVSGKLSATAFWFISLGSIGPKTLYQTSFGRLPARTIETNQQGFLKATTDAIDEAYAMPDYQPQPSMTSRNQHVGAVWVDKQGTDGIIWYSGKSVQQTGFTTPTPVTRSQHSPGSPKISMGPDGSAFITWTQSRYTESTLPSGADLLDLLAAQDVWVAAYDGVLGTVGIPVRLPDDSSALNSGRADAEPRIGMLDDNTGLVVWMALTDARDGSELWYADLDRSGTNISTGTPKKVGVPSGTNRNPVLIPMAGGKALLLWVNQRNATSSIESATWDGQQWSAPTAIVVAGEGESYDELAASITGTYGTMAWTKIQTDSTGLITAGVKGVTWDASTATWKTSDAYELRDTSLSFSTPQVSVSTDGRAILSYQATPRSPDSTVLDNGRRYIAVRDLSNLAGQWSAMPGFDFLSDTTSFVWEAQTSFSDNETLYLLTEEHGAAVGSRGAVDFGDRKLGLKLRAIRLTSDLQVEDVNEPDVPTSSAPTAEEGSELEISYEQTGDGIQLSYRLAREGHVRIDIFDVMGRQLGAVLDDSLVRGSYRTLVATGGLSSGMYVVRVGTARGVRSLLVSVRH